MTRYARAKGSKASNERLPNEATPWMVMKQQLEDKNKESLKKKRTAKELLKDYEENETNKNINNNWAEFSKHLSEKKEKKKSSKESIKHHERDTEDSIASRNINSDFSKCEKTREKKECKKSKSTELCTNTIENSKNNNIVASKNNSKENLQQTEHTEDTRSKQIHNKKGMFPKKKKQEKEEQDFKDSPSEEKVNQDEAQSNFTVLSKRQKRNLKRKLKTTNSGCEGNSTSDKISNYKGKEKKSKQEGNYKRRKPDIGAIKMIINGVETEIVKYDGFPVKKEDAERLADLKQQMTMKGIPKLEIDIAIKLERRKAEKALSRVKKHVCFNCRKSGHNLSDCPELGNEEGTGICFKCGSTEHTHFECKVNKDATYRYAKCFICREQGHIAVQCPDNPQGVYPNGGCCKICGAVTHLKKDCPDLVKAKEENAITVEKINDSALESLSEIVKEKDNNDKVKTKNKIVKF